MQHFPVAARLVSLGHRDHGRANDTAGADATQRPAAWGFHWLTKTFPIVLLFFFALTASAQKEVITVTDWHVHQGDNPAWAAPAFDDSQWATTTYDQWQYFFQLTSGTRWYRSTFQVPADFKGQELAVGMGPLDEVYDVFIDGTLLGRFGSWEPVPHAPFPRHLVFTIPPELLKGPIGHIAIRRWNGGVGLSWLPFMRSGYMSVRHPPQIGSKYRIEALEQLHPSSGAIQELPWTLTDVLFLFAAAISFVLFSVQKRRTEYLYLGAYCLLSGAPSLIGSVLATNGSVMGQSLGPAVIFFLFNLSFAFSLLFLASLCPRFHRILQVGAALAALFALGSGYGLWSQSHAAGLFWLDGQNYVVPFFEIIAMWGLFLDRRRGSFAIASFLLINAAAWAWVVTANKFHLPYFVIFAGPFVIAPQTVTGIAFIFVTLLVLYLRYRDEQDRQAAIDQDLAAARRMQQQLLAGSVTILPGFAVDAIYRPAREVGGDFYCTESLDDGSLLVIVGDVSGKGLDAAMLVAVILGSLANETHRSPASLLTYLNRAVMGRTAGGFITACCARFYPGERVVLANAGHISPYLNGRELQLENGLPLGIDLQTCYLETEMQAGGTVTFLSDGVVEARDAKGELFGFERVTELTRKGAAEIAETAQRWGQEDDITVLSVARLARVLS